MGNDILDTTVPPEIRALTAREVKEQVNLIQEIMSSVMQGPSDKNKNGVHYGPIPGCGDKYTLLKPGAEKLSMTFRLRPIMDNDRDIAVTDLGNGHREFRVYCHVLNSAGLELATGIGSCSTMESKYRYRGGQKVPTGKAVPKEYWNLKKEGKLTEAQAAIGGPGFGVMKGDSGWEICEHGEKMENPDIADVYNTVLKIAKKRAYIDGILSSTAASDIFTQDFDDMDPELAEHLAGDNGNGKTPEKTEPVADPQPKTETPKGEIIQSETVITNVLVEDKVSKKSGKGYKKYTVVLPGGEKIGTIDQKLADLAIKARDFKAPVAVSYKKGDYGFDLVAVDPIEHE